MDIQDIEKVRCILLKVTAAICNNGVEKRAMCWSFEMGIGAVSDKDWRKFVERSERIMII